MQKAKGKRMVFPNEEQCPYCGIRSDNIKTVFDDWYDFGIIRIVTQYLKCPHCKTEFTNTKEVTKIGEKLRAKSEEKDQSEEKSESKDKGDTKGEDVSRG